MAKWSGLACPDCGCKRMTAYRTNRILGGTLRVRACQDCGRRVHTIESITSARTDRGGQRRKKTAGSPSRPG